MLRIENPAASLKDIARALGYTHYTVYAWVKLMEYQRYEDFLLKKQIGEIPIHVQEERKTAMQKVQGNFESHAEEMQNRLLAIVDTVDDPDLVAKISMDWLDRAGASAPKDRKTNNAVVVMSEEMMEKFFARAAEAGLDVVDGEVSK